MKEGDLFYKINFSNGEPAAFRMQLRGMTISDVVKGDDEIAQYIRSRLSMFMKDDEIQQLMRVDETDIIALTVEQKQELKF